MDHCFIYRYNAQLVWSNCNNNDGDGEKAVVSSVR